MTGSCDARKRTGISAGLTFLLAALAIGNAGCPAVILRDVVTTGDAWTLTIRYVMDGPDGYTLNGFPSTYNTPSNGDKFYQVVIRLRNDSRARRDFNYDRCDLDAGDRAVVPSLIATALNYKGDRVEPLNPGETIGRTLIFSYPKGIAPTRLSCVPMVVALPATIPPR